MSSYTIVQACGKQFWLEEGRFYDFDKLPLNIGEQFLLNNILLVNTNNNISIGQPFLDDQYQVEVEVLRHVSKPKIRVYKMRPKKKTRRTFGAKPKMTRVLVKAIRKRTQVKSVCFI
uniref:ribosomal protein L21 n=1 Tax=Chrysotila carterae TaxID=13221 RepID=UPI0022F2D84C|nr:ribosomal protein L21 [Chrysotila carterae]WAK83136.1 ribosomal protein L21 [Chrysotila carterae]